MKNVKLLFFALILTFCSQREKDEFWLKKENQNGDISSFYASGTYCSKLKEESKDFEKLVMLLDSLNIKINGRPSTYPESEITSKLLQIDGIVNDTGYELYDIMQNMITAAGGYCANVEDLPILPYRYREIEEFWTDDINKDTFRRVLLNFSGQLNSFLGDKNSLIALNGGAVRFEIDKLKGLNTVEAMIYLVLIQIEVVDLGEQAKSILQSDN